MTDKIVSLYNDLISYYNSHYDEPNTLFLEHLREDFLKKQIKNYDLLVKHYKKLDNVALVYTSDPIGLCSLLDSSKITIICDHPLLERTKDFYKDTFNVDVKLINPLFNNIDYSEYDVLIFPEYEYFVPFDLINNFKQNKDIAIFYSIDKSRYTPGHSLALCTEDIEEMCNFTKEYSFGKYQFTSNIISYYGFGNR